eukprot:COSAG03_NODE_9739_length_696_cov_4.790620_1_plen_128_part_01
MLQRRSKSPAAAGGKEPLQEHTPEASDAQLLEAAKIGDIQAAKAARSAGAGLGARDSVSNDGITPLHWAAACGHAEVARYLLKEKTPVDQPSHSGSSALKLAARHGLPLPPLSLASPFLSLSLSLSLS